MNPWATPEGERARAEQFRLLAQGDGELAEYARDVLAGRIPARTVLYSSVLSGQTVDGLYQAVDRWRDLPAAERDDLVAAAPEETRLLIAELAAATVDEPSGSDDDGPGPITYDAW